jgi:exodeoxyribonuclease VII small subunit
MHPISGVGFCGPRSRPGGRSLRSSAPPPDLGHLDDESLASLSDRTSSEPDAGLDARLDRLEDVIARLSEPTAPLDRLVADHEAAGRLVEAARTRLDAAAERVARMEDERPTSPPPA